MTHVGAKDLGLSGRKFGWDLQALEPSAHNDFVDSKSF